jgi:hypothetical protein
VPDAINIDSRPDVAVEMPCRVELVDEEPFLIPHVKARWRAVLSRLAGKTVTVRIIRTKKRSLPQNSFLWGVVYADVLEGLRALAEEAGEPAVFATDEELHEAMKWLFLKRQAVLPGGEVVEVPGRSSRLTVEQFSEFVSRVTAWAAGYGIRVRSSDGG